MSLAAGMSAGSVVTTTEVAVQAFERLRSGATSERLHDLGHGKIELLREVLNQVSIRDEFREHQAALDSVKLILLLLKALLLGWESGGIPEKLIELPLVKLPKHSPNRCWKCKHPNKVVLLEESKACVCFLGTHVDVFAQEPWLWLHDVMDSIVLALEL